MNKLYFLSAMLLLIVAVSSFLKTAEGFSNYRVDQSTGDFPNSQTSVLVQDIYQPIKKNQISDENASDMWWNYPTFTLGSYKQITNNIRYPNNPDIGRCTPSSMCGALYHKNHINTNYVNPLPPANDNSGTRIGYFTTDERVITSLPYKTDGINILY